MLRHVLWDLALFMDENDRPNSEKRILAMLQALTFCNQLYLRIHPETPLIYQSGIKYKVPEQFESESVPELEVVKKYLADSNAPATVQGALGSIAGMVGGGEHFRDIPRIMENGGGDCDNVACWRAAELRELGIMARPMITWRKRPDGGTTYHVLVLWPDGTSEDPSLLLGMGGAGRAPDKALQEQYLGERVADFLSGVAKVKPTMLSGVPSVTTPQNFNQLQYTIPFQTDDSYEDWSPSRPQGFYQNPLYPNLPGSTGGPMFNTMLGRALGNAHARRRRRNAGRRAA